MAGVDRIMQWMFVWFASANSYVIGDSSTSTNQVLAFSQLKLKYSSKENQEDKKRSACGVDYLWIDSIPCLIKYLLIFLKTNNPLTKTNNPFANRASFLPIGNNIGVMFVTKTLRSLRKPADLGLSPCRRIRS